ncbi:lysophospholipid acyltransferase family protein [Antrihabitans stalactiti]|uniref:1-acyl-sn-glycerol-3-phosphate acyltransferase n=1 Tax=Antrihabitans stalactiti TaxID=2584121 RepID=A0A848K9V1_9NOCA|nr:lysophospholipid acyltransferase family protein [Antrihabitans stalactiti]NMN95181.1 1-acyl-sn-glycerol-3-phosphate acyltransferase [Antrihabitans stalactiti]
MARELVYDALNAIARTVLHAQGIRITIEGQDNIPTRGGAVIAANHTAYLDFVEVGLVGRNRGRNVRYMMKAELQQNRIVAFLMKHCKAIPVDRSAGHAAYDAAVVALRAGELVVVYPEATISRSFELKEFKSGAARMAIDANVPIVPVVIWGAHRVWTKGFPKQLGRHKFPINIEIGEPISPLEPVDGLTATLRTAMDGLLARAQQDYPAPAGEPWVPVRLGGSAPTLEKAHELEEAEFAARRAKAQRRKA